MLSWKKLSVLATCVAGLLGTGFTSDSLARNLPDNVKLAAVQELNYNTVYPQTIDPNLMSFAWESQIAEALFDQLVRQSWTGEYIGRGAESWSVSPDGLTWTFKLNPKAKWSDGKPVVAADYEYSFKRLTDPKTASQYGNYLELANVKNAHDVVAGKKSVDELGVKAVDDNTLVITLENPTPWLLRMMTISVLTPLRKDLIEKYGNQWTNVKNLVVNGPFVMKTNDFEDRIILEKNPNYWDADNVTITKINYSFIKDPVASYLGYQAGKYTSTSIPGKFSAKALQDFPNDVRVLDSQAVSYMYVNTEKVPDVRVRKAIALLLDTKTVTEKVLKNGKAISTIAPKNVDGTKYIKEQDYFNEPMAQRQKEAQELLKEAGYSKENPFTLELTIVKSSDQASDIAFREMINKGSNGALQLNFKVVERKGWQDALSSHNFQLIGAGWGADYDHITTFINQLQCGNVLNHAHICDKKADDLLHQAFLEKDKDKRNQLFAQAHEAYVLNYGAIPTWQQQAKVLVRPELRGYSTQNSNRYFADYFLVEPSSVQAAIEYEKAEIAKAKAKESK